MSVFALKDFTRGGQTTMHGIRMFLQSIRYIVMLSVFCSLVIFTATFFANTTSYERYLGVQYLEATIKSGFSEPSENFRFKSNQGRTVQMPLNTFIEHPATEKMLGNINQAYSKGLIYGLFFMLFVVAVIFCLFIRRGEMQRDKKEVRGARLSSPKALVKELKSHKEASDYTMAGYALKKDAEVQNILISGSNGTGKTTAMLELMRRTRANKQRAIVYDKKGTFVTEFYRPGKDIILNPLDERSPAWNIWAECHDGADFETIAQALMPEHLSGNDPFWVNAARTIFSSACHQLSKRGKCTMNDLLEPIFTEPENAEGLSKLLQGTVAETLVSEKIDKTALSIKATLSTYCKSLMFLKGQDEGADQVFSIRDWMQNEQDDSWIFISVVDNLKMPLLRPLITVWLDIAARSLLTLPLNRDRRIWLYYDELGTAHKLPSLEMTLAEGREYGSCNVVSVLDKSQLYERYTKNGADAMLSLFNTNVFFRTNSEDTAKWMSGLLGKREVIERRESLSMGGNDIRDGVSLSEERRVEPLVLDTEFTTLPNMEAYLRLPGEWPRCRIKFPFRVGSAETSPIVVRKTVDICAIEEQVMNHEAAMQLAIHKAPDLTNMPAKRVVQQPVTPLVSQPTLHPSQRVEEPMFDEAGNVVSNTQPSTVANASSKTGREVAPAFKEVALPNDEHALFRAIAAGLNINNGKPLSYQLEEAQANLRKRTVEMMKLGLLEAEFKLFLKEPDAPFKTKDNYLTALSNNLPAGLIEARVLSMMLSQNILCHSEGDRVPIPIPHEQPHAQSIHILDKGQGYYQLLIDEAHSGGISIEYEPPVVKQDKKEELPAKSKFSRKQQQVEEPERMEV